MFILLLFVVAIVFAMFLVSGIVFTVASEPVLLTLALFAFAMVMIFHFMKKHQEQKEYLLYLERERARLAALPQYQKDTVLRNALVDYSSDQNNSSLEIPFLGFRRNKRRI